jgi:hypothetical protein
MIPTNLHKYLIYRAFQKLKVREDAEDAVQNAYLLYLTYEKKLDISETGTVLSVGDGIARIYGVENAMAMELLASPYLAKNQGGVYSETDTARARIEHLESHILFWPYMAVVDAFQHWVYENPDAALDPSKLRCGMGAAMESFYGRCGLGWT